MRHAGGLDLLGLFVLLHCPPALLDGLLQRHWSDLRASSTRVGEDVGDATRVGGTACGSKTMDQATKPSPRRLTPSSRASSHAARTCFVNENFAKTNWRPLNTNEHNPGQNIGNKKDKEGQASCPRKCAIIYLSLPVSLARTPSALARFGLERPPRNRQPARMMRARQRSRKGH